MNDLISKLGYLAAATRFRRISEKLQYDGDKIYQEAGIGFKARMDSQRYTSGRALIQEAAHKMGNPEKEKISGRVKILCIRPFSN